MSMAEHKHRFLELAIAADALTFGDFTLKSGRRSPYFFNSGRIHGGAALATLGECYAGALRAHGLACDVLFGPAYKGIPLAVATAVALGRTGADVGVAYNRKEAKAHGEGGVLVGAPLTGSVVIIDDVISAGTAVDEAAGIVRGAGGRLGGVLVALDRAERGLHGSRSAIEESAERLAVPVRAIADLGDLLAYLREAGRAAESAAIDAYRREYGSR
jgi:orotate phosphoribosyltransferase